jgi:acetoin utilization protein AcuC
LVVDKVSIVYDKGIAEYDFGEEYSLRGDRFPRYLQLLRSEKVLDNPKIRLVSPDPATDDDLALVHSRNYIERVKEIAERREYLSDDTPLKPQIVRAVRLIVGAALRAGEEVVREQADMSQGVGGGLHHAGKDYGDAWCVFNDVAVCARAMTERHKLNRVLIFDTDAHTGNGTMDIFYRDPRVLYLSMHQDPATIYPHTGYVKQIGEGEGEGYTVNVPLPKEADDSCVELVLERVFRPIVRQFRPQVIIRNGGADPHYQDELAELALTYKGLWLIGRKVSDTAKEIGCGVVDLVCGGYNPGHEEWGLYALLSGSIGKPLTFSERGRKPKHDESVLGKTSEIVKELGEVLSPYWKID